MLIDVASGNITPLVNNRSADVLQIWSPDGKQFAYTFGKKETAIPVE